MRGPEQFRKKLNFAQPPAEIDHDDAAIAGAEYRNTRLDNLRTAPLGLWGKRSMIRPGAICYRWLALPAWSFRSTDSNR